MIELTAYLNNTFWLPRSGIKILKCKHIYLNLPWNSAVQQTDLRILTYEKVIKSILLKIFRNKKLGMSAEKLPIFNVSSYIIIKFHVYSVVLLTSKNNRNQTLYVVYIILFIALFNKFLLSALSGTGHQREGSE